MMGMEMGSGFFKIWVGFCAAIVFCGNASAQTYLLPPSDVDLIGRMQTLPAAYEDTLLDIARRHSLGQEEILLANPDVDRWLPGEGTPVVVPTEFILPKSKRVGIVLNVPEMRIYYFPKPVKNKTPEVQTFPVSVGRMDWNTPLGAAKVAAKVKDPVWVPPASIRAEHAAEGDILPPIVAAGPKNPLGEYALRLSIPGYLIHGTDKPWGIGMRVTHGCLRLYPEDINRLYGEVSVGTPVEILYQPVKVGWLLGDLYIEVHPPLDEDIEIKDKLMQTAVEMVEAAIMVHPVSVSGKAIRKAVEEQRGYPIKISTD